MCRCARLPTVPPRTSIRCSSLDRVETTGVTRMPTRRTLIRSLSVLLPVLLPAAGLPFAAQAQAQAQAQAPSREAVRDFFRAVQLDDASTVKSLLAAGFDPNLRNPIG